eukprot:546214-Prymnesium_polylepis.1
MPRHTMCGLDSNLDTIAVYAVAGHGLKIRLKAALDFGAESPRPREFQSSGKHAPARYTDRTPVRHSCGCCTGEPCMYTHNVRALLTSLQAANH